MTTRKPRKFHCWQCEFDLGELAKPLPRYEACPKCRAELHCCRMCVHFDAKLIGQCRHDRAERVERKHQANYCTFFRPSAHAFISAQVPPSGDAKAELDALFGLTEPRPEEPLTPASLFDLPPVVDDDKGG